MTTVSKFPLLQLPDEELLRTIRVMDFYQIMSFSLISKRCKQLVQSLQIKTKPEGFNVRIDTCISLDVFFPRRTIKIFLKSCDNNQTKRLKAPLSVKVNGRPLERIDFTYSDWLEHFQTIFHMSIYLDIHNGLCNYMLDDIAKGIGAIEHLFVRNTGCFATNLKLFQKLPPAEKLTIYSNTFQDFKIPLNILIQNYTTLVILGFPPTKMTLDELLVVNSKEIKMTQVKFSSQDLNKFIKFWMKGSNPRMELLLIFTFNDFQYERTIVMKGIKASNERRGGTDPHRRKDLYRMDIYRMDGTRATISFYKRGFEISTEFHHCAIEKCISH
ncbi:hypothetical protein CAEBREN_15392 [Caenorhabditis brenneri]|uniref:F-box domain-containing protein n=1 Tax=Caenorhabditis brenneri TaxID=135651 RepID=G0P3R9_CAEBE|nr:hypothetical protein CAEBREN_15392 [Caenorhabditis brenneri]